MENKAAKTAFGPLFQVALEQLVPQEQRLIHDAVAFQFLPACLQGVVNLCRVGVVRNILLALINLGGPGIRGGVLCRKRYITDKLGNALRAGMQSFVILGCGFDPLAYRVPELTTRQVYEVDLPEVIRASELILQRLFGQVPRHVKLIPIDFNNEDLLLGLINAGFSMTIPAFFVWEGVSQYISESAVGKVFTFLKQTSSGSELVFTYIRKEFIDGKQLYGQRFLYRQTRLMKQLWLFGLEPKEIEIFLEQYAWKVVDQAGNVEYQERYLTPVNRILPIMEVEKAVFAERKAG
jgi:methyltransferase (TIGR00027 family)